MQQEAASFGSHTAASVVVCVGTFSNRLKTNSFKLALD